MPAWNSFDLAIYYNIFLCSSDLAAFAAKLQPTFHLQGSENDIEATKHLSYVLISGLRAQRQERATMRVRHARFPRDHARVSRLSK